MQHRVFLTGATGFIGASLLQTWLDRSDAIVTVLARAKRDETPDRRIRGVLSGLYPESSVPGLLERVRVVEGDMTLDRLGLGRSDYERLTSETTHVIHCAAAARFDLKLEDARRENVGGTGNVLEFGRACGGLQRIDYIGTAYVAGKRKGLIRENELDEGQQHNNTYERTKMEAEKLVRQNIPVLPLTIFRPSIVICDSKTGRATNHNGFYRALSMYWQDMLKILPGSPETRLDLVPVDYVADATYSISTGGDSVGQCYHLAAGRDASVRLADIRDLASFHFGKKKLQIISPEEFNDFVAARRPALSEKERDMIDEVLLYLPYLTGDLAFDISNARQATGPAVPRVETYFKTMADYVMRH